MKGKRCFLVLGLALLAIYVIWAHTELKSFRYRNPWKLMMMPRS